MFAKLMSISDVLMWRYFDLLSFRPMAEIARLQGRGRGGPATRATSRWLLAQEIVARFHSQQPTPSARWPTS